MAACKYCCAPQVFPWKDLDPDLQDKILRRVVLRFVFNQHFERRVPLELLPPLSYARNTPYADTIQSLVIQRFRSNILGYGPNDTLTVSFSDCVDRDGGFNYLLWEKGYDEDAVCRAMDIKCTWTGVFKIRLVFNENYWLSEVQDNYDILFVRRGVDGNEEVVAAPTMFSIWTRGNKEAFARRLVEELRLTRRIVAGCDEFTC
jgi:hypothetical protein